MTMRCEICLHLYSEIITRRPEWHDEDPPSRDEEGSSYWKIAFGFARIRVLNYVRFSIGPIKGDLDCQPTGVLQDFRLCH